jgi:hypothetical protein
MGPTAPVWCPALVAAYQKDIGNEPKAKKRGST